MQISSLDSGYETGLLSLFPESLDTKENLYEVRNNAETKLLHSLGHNGKRIIVEDASSFPDKGLLRIGPSGGKQGNFELIHYAKKTGNIFSELTRGFAGSIQTTWEAKTTYVSNAVMAEHHNAIKDALIKIESKLGIKKNPDEESMHGRLIKKEEQHLAPRASFRAYPLTGVVPLTVNFHSFTNGHVIRHLWDFGDGTTSTAENPTHTYNIEGNFSVRLDIITSTGARGITTKSNYIEVSHENTITFFYIKQDEFSPNTYHFIDQSDGEILQRFWIYGDGEQEIQEDPDIHTATHTYTAPGEYSPSLVLVYSGQRSRRVFLLKKIEIE